VRVSVFCSYCVDVKNNLQDKDKNFLPKMKKHAKKF